MPSYDYRCLRCGEVKEFIHGINESPLYTCCGETMIRVFSLNKGGFIFKGGTPAIHYRESRNRLKRSEEMKKRQIERYGDSIGKVIPNVNGVPTGSWSDAQKIAKDKGLNTGSYTPFVEKENKKKIIV